MAKVIMASLTNGKSIYGKCNYGKCNYGKCIYGKSIMANVTEPFKSPLYMEGHLKLQ